MVIEFLFNPAVIEARIDFLFDNLLLLLLVFLFTIDDLLEVGALADCNKLGDSSTTGFSANFGKAVVLSL